MKALLTGSSGFVGAALCVTLEAVEAIELRTLGRPRTGRALHYEADLSAMESLEEVVAERIDVVIHAVKSFGQSDGHQLDLPVFRYTAERGIPLLFFSSVHDHPSRYISGKRTSERWLLDNHRHATILRIGHVFGPHHPHAYFRRRIVFLAHGFPFCLNPQYTTHYTAIADICRYCSRWVLGGECRHGAVEISRQLPNADLDATICRVLGRRPPWPLNLDVFGIPSALKQHGMGTMKPLGRLLDFCVPDPPQKAPWLPGQAKIDSDVVKELAETVRYYVAIRR